MSLTERHRWCANKMLEAFGPELTTEAVQAFIRQDANLQKFLSFFKGEGSGRIFVFFQPDMADGEVSYFVPLFSRKQIITRFYCQFSLGRKTPRRNFSPYQMVTMG